MDKLDRILTAIARNQVATFKKLVTAENVDAVDEDGCTLLDNVILDEDADAEMARYLIDLGAAINRIGDPDEKWTALALALRDGRTEIAKMLLDAGAKPIAKDSSGNTPLHYAMHCLGYDHIPQEPILEMVAILLARGADPRQKNRDGDSPLSMAKWGELPNVVAMFKQSSNRGPTSQAIRNVSPQRRGRKVRSLQRREPRRQSRPPIASSEKEVRRAKNRKSEGRSEA